MRLGAPLERAPLRRLLLARRRRADGGGGGRCQAALDLAEDQRQRLLAARTYLLAQMVEIIQERTLIISMLQARPVSGLG